MLHRPVLFAVTALLASLSSAVEPSTAPDFSTGPRARVLLDSGWRFHLGDPTDVTPHVTDYPEMPALDKLTKDQLKGAKSEAHMETLRADIFATHAGEDVSFVKPGFDDRSWCSLNLPHDWALELPFDSRADYNHGFRALGDKQFGANNIGWYRRTFAASAADAEKQFSIELDGAYRNSLVWLNGHILGRNVSGYIGRHFDATPYIKPGADNVLVVRVDASRFEGWFYEGAGIYRHVWLTKTNPVHVAPWGTYVHTTSLSGDTAQVAIETEVNNQGKAVTSGATLTSTVYDAEGKTVAVATSPLDIAVGQTVTAKQEVSFKAKLWSPKTPYLYTLVTTVKNQNAVADVYQTPFGVRTVVMDPNMGVILNGEPVEILGMCNHQDHAGVGVALPDRVQYYRLERLLSMGVNAYRTSHNAPTPELLDACDQLGMLVMDENRRIGTDDETMSQFARLIRRDRNHPSIFIWSLGNEETHIQGTPAGAEVVRVMQDRVHSLDPSRRCTIAMNHDWGSGFSTVIDVQGFNYFLTDMDAFHAKFPNQPAIGTETDSHVADRGIYANDPKNGFVTGYTVRHKDVPWGDVPEVWWTTYNERPWSSGGFGWTGFDYRGEPTPYVKNYVNTGSHFGTLDQCGFPKDDYYYFQANWTLKPVLHLFPHWNWEKPGAPVNVWVFGNCRAVELFLNGASLGRKSLDGRKHLEWNVPYAPGTLKAVGYDAFGAAVVSDTVVTAGDPAGIQLIPDRSTLQADGRDVSMVTVAVVDAQGNIVPTASNDISFSVKGGVLIGVGNGNPSSHEDDKADHRKVFNGLAQVIVQSAAQPGRITLTATSPPPAAPTGVSAVAGHGSVTVSWDIVPGAVTYNLLRSEKAGGPYQTLATGVSGVGLGYVDRTAVTGTRYFYTVSANGHGGVGPHSAEVHATPDSRVAKVGVSVSERQARINWEGIPGERYNLKRADVAGGPYKVVASAISGTEFTDLNLTPGRDYHYVVTQVTPGGESPESPEVLAKLPGPIPPQFTSAQIGPVGTPGVASFREGQFTIASSGANIWDRADAFHYVYANSRVGETCDLRARVVAIQGSHPNAKVGLMIRAALDAGSPHATVVVTPGAGIEWLTRSRVGGTTSAASVAGLVSPVWIRLVRAHDVFTAYWSDDGEKWNQIGKPTTIPLSGQKAYAGMAVCSLNQGTCTGVIEGLTPIGPDNAQ